MPPLPADLPLTPAGIVIAGVVLTFLINGLLDYAKSFAFLSRLPSDVYRFASFVLGIVGFIASSFLQNQSLPTTPDAWILLVVLGLAEGLAAGTAYDDRQRRKTNNALAAYEARNGTLKLEAEAEIPDGAEPREVIEEMATQVGVKFSNGRLVEEGPLREFTIAASVPLAKAQGQAVPNSLFYPPEAQPLPRFWDGIPIGAEHRAEDEVIVLRKDPFPTLPSNEGAGS